MEKSKVMNKKKVILLGATGSVGVQALDVIAAHPDLFELVGFAFGNNIDQAREIIQEFDPKVVVSSQSSIIDQFKAEFPKLLCYSGDAGLSQLAQTADYDVLLNAIDRKSTRLNSSHQKISYAV